MKTISRESAKKIFIEMCEGFGFSIPEEAKTQRIETKLGNVSATVINDIDNAKITIDKIMDGTIEYKTEKEEPKIIYHLKRPIISGQIKVDNFIFGVFPLKKAKATGIPLSEMNPSMDADQLIQVLQSMTGIAEEDVFLELGFSQFNDLRSIVNYFLV